MPGIEGNNNPHFISQLSQGLTNLSEAVGRKGTEILGFCKEHVINVPFREGESVGKMTGWHHAVNVGFGITAALSFPLTLPTFAAINLYQHATQKQVIKEEGAFIQEAWNKKGNIDNFYAKMKQEGISPTTAQIVTGSYKNPTFKELAKARNEIINYQLQNEADKCVQEFLLDKTVDGNYEMGKNDGYFLLGENKLSARSKEIITGKTEMGEEAPLPSLKEKREVLQQLRAGITKKFEMEGPLGRESEQTEYGPMDAGNAVSDDEEVERSFNAEHNLPTTFDNEEATDNKEKI